MTINTKVVQSYDNRDAISAIGIMSGTSMDGIDSVLMRFTKHSCQFEAHHHLPYPFELRNALEALIHEPYISLAQLSYLHGWLGHLYADSANKLMRNTNVSCEMIDVIGCHGQTIHHAPDAQYAQSYQIGNGNIVAQKTGIQCICDFRNKDMALGGQGAPLVPAFHQSVFSSTEENRIILNIGGIANITYLPLLDTSNIDTKHYKNVIGYDTGPGNLLMDYWIKTKQGFAYDFKGQWARSGAIDYPLLNALLKAPFFSKSYPKSAGADIFNAEWLTSILNQFERPVHAENVQATLCELTAITIAREIDSLTAYKILICGGGSFNDYLIERLQYHLPYHTLEPSNQYGLHVSHVEAGCFAWLAKQYLLDLPGNCPEVTGATRPTVLGCCYKPT